MSDRTMPEELLVYARNLFSSSDSQLESLTQAARAFGMPVGWEITSDVGRLFQLLCQAIGARKILEFGTLAGHSALWFSRALTSGGKVISIEMNPEYAHFATNQIQKLGAGDRVEIRIGQCLEMLPELTLEAPFDVIFLDADKAHYPQFLSWSERVLRPGGLLLADNVLRSDSWNGQTLLDPKSDDPRILAIREFNDRLSLHPCFTSLIVPIRAGIAVGLFTGKVMEGNSAGFADIE